MSEGWIQLHRKIQDCEIWDNNQPYDMRSAWIDLLLLANHKDVEIIFDYEPMTIKRGQYLTSVRKLSARWSWSKDRTLKYLRLLESLKMIHRESDKQRTLITIEKYEVYQSYQDTTSYTTLDTGRTQNGHDLVHGFATNNNDNNDNNDNNENKKHIYGEYRHIRLTDKERDRLFNDFGEAETLAAIKFLDEYKQRKGYKSKDDNLTLRKWVFDAVKEEQSGSRATQNQTQAKSLAEKWGLSNDT